MKSLVVPQREADIKDLKEVKDRRLKQKENEIKGMADVVKPRYRNEEYDALLAWYQVSSNDIKAKYRYKADKVKWWSEEMFMGMVPPPAYEPWTDEDEAKLVELEKFDIDFGDTMAGRLEDNRKKELLAAIAKMSKEERDNVRSTLATVEDAGTSESVESEQPAESVESEQPDDSESTLMEPI